MRPLKLKFAGLRSYLTEQEIDFSSVNLMAIVGDTGVGKSSILEALCFALYGMSTWDARSGKGLIADGGDGTVRAELTFQAKGKKWKVTRTNSAGVHPPSNHRLICLDDDSSVVGARGVDNEIRRLVGLDHATFLKAVVLPQGRFQELLQTRESDRTNILKSVLGLEHITEVRSRAKTLYDELFPRLSELRERRAGMMEDPERALHEALRQLSDSREEIEKLEKAKKIVTEARKSFDGATRRASEYRKVVRRLDSQSPVNVGKQYEGLIALDAEIRRELAPVEDQLRTTSARAEELAAVITRADNDSTGEGAASAALATLRSLLEQLPANEDERKRHEDECASIEAARVELRKRKESLAEIVRKEQQAREHSHELSSAHQAAVDALARQRQLLTEARRTATEVENAAAKVEKTREKVERADKEAAEAETVAAQADKKAADAAQQFEAASRMNSAAHAAAHSKSGDPCPVCMRVLPDDFEAPGTTDLAREKSARTRADKYARAQAEERAAAVEARNAVNRAVEEFLEEVREAINQHEMSISLVTSELGEVDLDLDDDFLLADQSTKVRAAAEALKEAEDAVAAAQDAKTKDSTEIRSDEKGLVKRETALFESREALKRRHSKLTKSYNALPTFFRTSEELNVSAIEQALESAQHRQTELERVRAELREAQAEEKRLQDAKRNLLTDIQERVEKPANQLSRSVQAVADLATVDTDLADLPAMPERPEPFSITADAQWASGTLDQVSKTIRRYQDEESTQESLAAREKVKCADALGGLGFATSEEMDDSLVEAKMNLKIAKRDRDEAQAQLPVCAELDQRIAAAAPLIDSLRELGSLLADGKFMAAVVKRRQRALLGIASDLLRSMTGERFGFSDDFRIIDAHTGQPRDVKTLSGGETFLASLALALALVQLTSRGGGRVEALFLDEGFGSLDANVLAEALEALTGQATGGRLVAVISHMRAVAENFDDVLMVTRALSGGSKAKWADQAERDRLVADDLATGLLS